MEINGCWFENERLFLPFAAIITLVNMGNTKHGRKRSEDVRLEREDRLLGVVWLGGQ